MSHDESHIYKCELEVISDSCVMVFELLVDFPHITIFVFVVYVACRNTLSSNNMK